MISKTLWGNIIKDFQKRRYRDIVQRDIHYPLDIPLDRAVVLSGPRRSGKTYLMYLGIKELLARKEDKNSILYVNFEDSRLVGAVSQDLNTLLEVFFEFCPDRNKKTWVFLDEIQVIPDWERFVRTLVDMENVNVFVTGSSSKLMSKEIATSMRGRSLTYNVYPFSFAEVLKAGKLEYEEYLSSAQMGEIIQKLKDYVRYGGFPETVRYREEWDRILSEIVDVTIFRDIVERYDVKNIKMLKLFLNAIFNSKEFSIHKFYNFLKSQGHKVSKNTLYTYFGYFEDSFIVFPLKRFSYSYKNIESSISKMYLVDNGLLSLQGIRDYGRLIENIVFIELKRRSKGDLFYYKSTSGREIDFIIKEGKKVSELIQVCYTLDDFVTKEREVKALLQGSEELRCDNLLIITWDYEAVEIISGKNVRYVSLCKWLLD
ncbi:MAG: ATP-binding protein [ANME-2 cluster archaeon]|nr:ATP-binding protein [ANME-2 cluster archaeon]MBC2701161.1 ATP-binding protein [ANME-2 cluster archaeon]MBC2707254.1 ATP-binding protein [ANME-2 cluster archaeon]MBC2762219.1 ATP-binding protein [ANME-2 cluster archaeon]